MKDDRHEELVEEIAQIMVEADVDFRYHRRSRTSEEDYKARRDYARRIIAATLKAVVDGMPLPGEVGRGEGRVGESFDFPDTRKGYNYSDGFRWGWGRRLDRAAFSTEAAEPTDLDELEGQLIPFIALSPISHREEEDDLG